MLIVAFVLSGMAIAVSVYTIVLSRRATADLRWTRKSIESRTGRLGHGAVDYGAAMKDQRMNSGIA